MTMIEIIDSIRKKISDENNLFGLSDDEDDFHRAKIEAYEECLSMIDKANEGCRESVSHAIYIALSMASKRQLDQMVAKNKKGEFVNVIDAINDYLSDIGLNIERKTK